MSDYSKDKKNKTEKLPVMFSITESRELLPKIYKITEKYYKRVEKLRVNLLDSDDPQETKRLENNINKAIHKWAEEMVNYEVKVVGLWSVDFDSGDGIYYYWKFPEIDINYFHIYEKGIEAKRPISLLEGRVK
ncbi:MAG: DUF2203 family protein [Spirochaetota bacterium]